MRHIFLSVVLAFGLGVFACSDDDPDPPKTVDKGVTTADKGVTTADKGVTTADKGVTTADKGVTTDGAALQCDPTGTTGTCTNAEDCALLDTPGKRDGISDAATACGMGCLADADPAACSTTCLTSGDKDTGLSADCAGCYVGILMCVMANCVTVCVPDSSTPACITCQKDKGCLTAFYTCTGLPVPTM